MTVLISFSVVLLLAALIYALSLYNASPRRAQVFKIWLTFTVVIGLMPIILNALSLTYFTKESLNISTLLVRGELFIVSVAVGSDAIGRIFSSKDVSYTTPSGVCFVLIIVSSFLYAISSLELPPDSLNTDNTPMLSVYIFMMTVVSSGLCVLQAEE